MYFPDMLPAPSYPCQLCRSNPRDLISVLIASATFSPDVPLARCTNVKNYYLMCPSLSTKRKTRGICSLLVRSATSSARIEKNLASLMSLITWSLKKIPTAVCKFILNGLRSICRMFCTRLKMFFQNSVSAFNSKI